MQAHGFRFYFTPLPGCFPPFPHGTGTLSVFGSLQPCGMVPADSDRIPRAPPYSGAGIRIRTLPVRGCHPLRPRFPDMLRFARMRTSPVLQPRRVLERGGLGSSLFDRHYYGNRLFLSSPPGTKMFQFPGFAPARAGARPSAVRVAPFGHVRINSRLQIPGHFRSLPRPSSPAEAKASSVRSDFSFSVNLSLL